MSDEAIRRLVSQRANYRCEYCQLRHEDDIYIFHLEHIIPKKHFGESEVENFAYACHQCNLHKGPNLTGIDPESRLVTQLFHPRNQAWNEHFAFRGPTIIGLTATGRTTVYVLNMNDEDRLEARRLLGYGNSTSGK